MKLNRRTFLRSTGIAIALLLGAVTITVAAESRWVERTKVDIRAGKGSFYEIVETVGKGDQVEVLPTEDKWMSVRTKLGSSRGDTGLGLAMRVRSPWASRQTASQVAAMAFTPRE